MPGPRSLHIGKYYPPFAGGIETFSAELLRSLHNRSTPVAALVHDHLPPRQRRQTPDNEVFPYPVNRVPTYGNLLYAPVSPGFPARLNRMIRRFKPDLLHLHMPNTSAFAALLLPAARRLPWVIHWHADVAAASDEKKLSLAYPFYRPFEQAVCRRAAAIIVTSPPYLASSISLRPWRHKCQVIPMGIDPEYLPALSAQHKANAETLWGTARLRILTVGRLSYFKGHSVLVQAAAHLPSDSRIIIVGAGDQHTQLQQQIRTHQLEHRVLLAGRKVGPEVLALFASCDLFCLPSIGRAESFGMALLNALYYARPVVASHIPGSGVGWVVRDGVNGLLVPVSDPQALAQAFMQLGCDPDQRTMLGNAGQARFHEQFDLARITSDVQRLYRQVLT